MVSAPDPPALVIRRAGDLTQRTGLSASCPSDSYPKNLRPAQQRSPAPVFLFLALHSGTGRVLQSGERPEYCRRRCCRPHLQGECRASWRTVDVDARLRASRGPHTNNKLPSVIGSRASAAKRPNGLLTQSLVVFLPADTPPRSPTSLSEIKRLRRLLHIKPTPEQPVAPEGGAWTFLLAERPALHSAAHVA
jgi:hypothetical protein